MLVIKPTTAAILEVVKWLNKGMVVAAPTETAYGLLANATSNQAVRKVLKIKGRSTKLPIALLVSDISMAKKYAHLSPLALKLANQYWPGPLTMVVPAKPGLAKAVKSGGYVGMRVPGQLWLRTLIKKNNKPLTATSANVSGHKNLYSSSTVRQQLIKRGLKFLVDGGRLPHLPSSTIVKVINKKIIVIRPGSIRLKNHV